MEKVITETNIQEILASSKVVMIDFWAAWCGPCRILIPTVDEIAEEFAGRATIAKCNVEDCEDVAVTYGIRNIPALLYFKDGQLVDRSVGLVSKAEIEAKLNSLL
ncbi:MAG: thioredoxin [Bacteroidales bacterium]|nr:thioredoxin [Bacteroidales bacterium]